MAIWNYLRDKAGSRSLVFDLSITHESYGSSSHPQNGHLTHPQHTRRTSTRLCILLRSARSIAIGSNLLKISTFLFSSPRHCQHLHPLCTANFCVFFSTGPQEIRRNATNTQTHSILPGPEGQSRTCGSQSGGVQDQPQYSRLWRSRTPNARSLSRSPSSPPPFFTPSPYPQRSLVRDGQTRQHRPWLVVSRRTCPPLSPSPHANSFVIGTA